MAVMGLFFNSKKIYPRKCGLIRIKKYICLIGLALFQTSALDESIEQQQRDRRKKNQGGQARREAVFLSTMLSLHHLLLQQRRRLSCCGSLRMLLLPLAGPIQPQAGKTK
jgi:hypothetical protein